MSLVTYFGDCRNCANTANLVIVSAKNRKLSSKHSQSVKTSIYCEVWVVKIPEVRQKPRAKCVGVVNFFLLRIFIHKSAPFYGFFQLRKVWQFTKNWGTALTFSALFHWTILNKLTKIQCKIEPIFWISKVYT